MGKSKPDVLHKKTLALVVLKPDDKEQDQCMLYQGTIIIEDDVPFFEQESDKIKFILVDEWLLKIEEVPGDMKDTLFQSDYMISLQIGDGPDQIPLDKFTKTGLKWGE